MSLTLRALSAECVGLCALLAVGVAAHSDSPLIAAALHAQQRTPPLPTIHLLYPAPEGSVFDRNCSELLKDAPAIDRKLVEEAVRRAPEFQRIWDKEGPAYLTATFEAIGLTFPFREMQAALTVCPVPSMSLPLMINVRGFLASAGNPAPDSDFPRLVFHELMHTYTRSVNVSSALRKKHASEPPVTLNHLHVLALEKFVLTKLGRTAQLKALDERYRTRAPATYKRAWEIVNDVESVDAFLAELKTAAR